VPSVGQRGEFLRKVITQVRTQDYPYDERAPRKVDWHAYDVAQANEIADMLELIRVSVDAAAKRIEDRRKRPRRDRGQPPVPTQDVVKVLLLQSYFGVSNRVAEGLTRILDEKLGLTKPFSYKTIERSYDRRAVNALLDEVLAISNAPVEGLETAFGIDGSGTPTRKRQNYAETREGQRKKPEKGSSGLDAFPKAKHDFVYSVFVVGATFKLISAWRSTARHDLGELAFFEPLMRETKVLHPGMEMALGDGLYATRPCANLARELGAVLRSLPRRNVTLKRLGPTLGSKCSTPSSGIRRSGSRSTTRGNRRRTLTRSSGARTHSLSGRDWTRGRPARTS